MVDYVLGTAIIWAAVSFICATPSMLMTSAEDPRRYFVVRKGASGYATGAI